jgi:hypothetical protein
MSCVDLFFFLFLIVLSLFLSCLRSFFFLHFFFLLLLLTISFSVQISVGIHEICTKSVKFEHGTCRWGEWLKADRIILPEDPDQIPDIFIYLLREDNKPVCFYRLKPFRDVKTKELMGFDRQAEWILLQEDKSIDALEKGSGSLCVFFLSLSHLVIFFVLTRICLSWFLLFLSFLSLFSS